MASIAIVNNISDIYIANSKISDMTEEMIAGKKQTYWWVPMIFGAIFIATGIWILKAPAESFAKISMFIGIIILMSGTSGLFLTIMNRRGIPGWGFQLAGALIDIGIGLILLINPEILLKIITIFSAIWLTISGVLILRRAFEFRERENDHWRWEMILGIVLLLLAILLLLHPMILGLTIAIWTAVAFIALGVFRIALTIRLKRLKSKIE